MSLCFLFAAPDQLEKFQRTRRQDDSPRTAVGLSDGLQLLFFQLKIPQMGFLFMRDYLSLLVGNLTAALEVVIEVHWHQLLLRG